MTRFRDVYLDDQVPGYPCISSPRWSTLITQVDSGAERANQRWEHPLHTYVLPEAIREHATFEALHDQWLIMRGPAYSFPFRDPLDFASVPLDFPNTEPVIDMMDSVIGTGDGATMVFQLYKNYTRGGFTYTRPIYHPIVDTVVVAINGVAPENVSPTMSYTVSRETGEVTFSYPPNPGVTITAGFYFDVEVRFESDESFEGVVRTYSVSGFADLTLYEIRPC